MLKLSELSPDQLIARDGVGGIYEVSQVIDEITRLGETHHESKDWYTLKPAQWIPDAKSMIERYLECEQDDKYEDWFERTLDCFSKEDFDKIQEVLESAVKRDGTVTTYYDFVEKIEIDVYPDKI